MARSLTKLPCVLLALSLWIPAGPASLAEEDDPNALNQQVSQLIEQRKYQEAIPIAERAVEVARRARGPEDAETADSLNNLGVLFQRIGDYSKAEPLLQEALRTRQNVLGSEHPDTAESLNDLGELYLAMGEYAKGEPLFQEALRIWQKVLGPEHPYTALSLNNFALLEFDLGQIDEATALARQASAAQLRILSKIFSFTSEQQRLAYLDIFDPYSLFTLLKGTEADLAAAVLRYKGVVLDSIVEDRLLAEASQGSQDQKLVDQLNLDKSQLGQLLLQPAQKLSAETNQRIEALEGEVERIEGQLAQHVAGLGKARHALGVSLEQVQLNIPNDGALIEYLRYRHYLGKGQFEQRYGAIVLLSKGAPIWIPLSGAKEIEAALNRYDDLVRGTRDDDEMAAILQKLYQEVWEPIAQALPANLKRVIISPDGQLNFLSFATLLDGDKRFIAEKYSIQYVASGRDLLQELKPPSDSSAAIVFAAPDFDLSSSQTVADGTSKTSIGVMRGNEKTYMEDLSFPPLDGTETERAKLTRVFVDWRGETISLGGKDATKEILFRIHSPYILHLATHGFFASEDESDTGATELQPVSLQTSVFKSKFFNNPMHRSGLALAGAQTTIEAWKREEVPPVENDGILTAEDVSTLDLQGTWLVTLSACDTGSGEARAGEGVLGLRRGFIQAGAQNLLMTLWPISDQVTVQIMSDFYEAAHKTGNAPEALAEVQRNWLVKVRARKGLAQAVNLAGPFIMSSQGKP
jgi:CHAT domain-containing protein